MSIASNYLAVIKTHLDTTKVSANIRKSALEAIREQWENNYLQSYDHWRLTGEQEHLDHMEVCNRIANGLETL